MILSGFVQKPPKIWHGIVSAYPQASVLWAVVEKDLFKWKEQENYRENMIGLALFCKKKKKKRKILKNEALAFKLK